MKTVPVKTYYLEMREPVREELPPPRAGVELERSVRPTVESYRAIYDAVGRDWRWVDRKVMPDEKLAEIIHDPRVEVWVLKVDGVAAGYAELDRRAAGEVELAYFGLAPPFLGQGLGKYLLNRALRRAWSFAPSRVWLHTCVWDHPAALPCYRKAGLAVVREGFVDQVVL